MSFGKNFLRGRDRAWFQHLLYFIIEKLYKLSVEIRISLCDTCLNEKECLLFLFSLDCPFITLSILEGITSNYQLWSLKKKFPVT